MSGLKQWCKESGPIGPVLLAFEMIIKWLASDTKPDQLDVSLYGDEIDGFGMVCFLILVGPAIALIVLLMVMP